MNYKVFWRVTPHDILQAELSLPCHRKVKLVAPHEFDVVNKVYFGLWIVLTLDPSLSLSSSQVLEDVTGEEFVLLMRILSGLKSMQTVSGRQQLVELVVEQAFLEQALNPADADSVDRLLQCTRQALPLFSVSETTATVSTSSISCITPWWM